MSLKCGIVGLPNVGKSTLFNALTQTAAAEAANYPFCTIEPNIGDVGVPDERLDTLARIGKSAATIPTRLTFVDIAGLVRGASKGEGLGNQFLANIREVDAVAHVVRCFSDHDVTHVTGTIDPIADIETIETELMLADLDSLERRVDALEKRIRGQDKEAKETLDLVQLHCPPTEVYYHPELFGALDELVKQGKIRYYGVSVEKVEEAIKAIEYPNVQAVQIIFNIFRQRPADLFFDLAKKRQVGILARVPLSSGMLSGRMTAQTQFSERDHRTYNRYGEAFDRGETFSGIDYENGLQVVEELRALVPEGMTMAQFVLRWILMFDAVTCAIPGAKRPSQAEENVFAADLPALSGETMQAVRELYQARIQPLVHHYW